MGMVEFFTTFEKKWSFWVTGILLFILVVMLGSSVESLSATIAIIGVAFVVFYVVIQKYIS